MRRRRYLALLGVGSVGGAGCLSDGDGASGDGGSGGGGGSGDATSSDAASSGTDPTATTSGPATTSADASTSTGTPTESPTPTESGTPTPLPTPDVFLGDTTLRYAELDAYNGTVADVLVTSRDELPTRQLCVKADWFDDGEQIGTTEACLPTLAAGERWAARVSPWPEIDRVSRINGAETYLGGVEAADSLDPSGVEIVERVLLANRSPPDVRIDLQNTREKWISHLGVVVKLLDADGVVLGHARGTETNVSPGQELRFTFQPSTVGRDDAVESMSVVLTDAPLIE